MSERNDLEARMSEEKKGIGCHFEKRVENRLRANFPGCEVMHDVRIPGRRGNITQIDFLLFDETGIYVIEAKGYSGKVAGLENQVWWKKRIIDKEGHTRESIAMNPIRQNEGHVKYLERLIDNPRIPVISVSVISDKCDFSSIEVSGDNTYMFHLKNFASGIQGIMDSMGIRLSSSNIERLKARITS